MVEEYKECLYGSIAERSRTNDPTQKKGHPYYLALAGVFALSRCRGDNAPVKVYDYLRTGKAIVATDIQALRVLLSKETAILVEPNSRALADGILIALKHRPKLIQFS